MLMSPLSPIESLLIHLPSSDDDTRAYSKDIGIELEEPEKLKISLK